ncbi:hypothetical protein CO058_00275 [candidate division WWE3 bacterium CG_4_9_14_0_2_um_filter_35_11]|uniref:Helix-turn-helix type 11 domain-containing protein n=1 Tax=candidate division WWE3 bacterium CG_4_9_14_0_2_um_filter_35_11 TaxID=1975077 RepID=A0A2M8EMW6_UNCKA|nr:MAG: hypothetical protein COV25_00235 [candidate division WWE3 bacterium CG10_big_fil_rev_8_21_14_0_10_35_32]PJC24051.1 MAG: hypothetical protein CO058_00275 [candidate division WWE3 bacterium CG_4_9_14_0_2_um_filter_35_11]
MKTSKKIIAYILSKGEASAFELTNYLGISSRAVFKQLKNLVNNGKLIKKGAPPRVYYMVSEVPVFVNDSPQIPDNIEYPIIEEHFFHITPTGKIEQGFDGFVKWCEKRNLPLEKSAQDYKSILQKYKKYFNEFGLIDGMKKFKSSFAEVFLNEVYYLDFYSIERFGKTKLGQKLLYAKQSQNKKLISDISDEVNARIKNFIKTKKVDAVGFIPPTVKRETQFIKEFARSLNLKLPQVKIVKVGNEVSVPQKTLSKLEDRIENAKSTIVVDDQRSFNIVLIIDDAIGSGATLNETAKSLKQKGIAKKVLGVSVTGSFKGFDVISEV